MKYLVISDIHGGAESLEKVLSSFGRQVDFIILCGDYLNHGPRNPLPEGWNPKKTAELLNANKQKIICVRGNCDSEVDEMVLEFPCLASYTTVLDSGRRIFVHHGHLYDRAKLENWLPPGTLILSGHTHVAVLEKSGGSIPGAPGDGQEEKGFCYFNPGSISLPKGEEGRTFGLVEINSEGEVKINLCSIDGKVLKELDF